MVFDDFFIVFSNFRAFGVILRPLDIRYGRELLVNASAQVLVFHVGLTYDKREMGYRIVLQGIHSQPMCLPGITVSWPGCFLRAIYSLTTAEFLS